LFNNSNANSTVMPEIDLGGQLPENPYIETADGYRWKYLYKIPPGLKEKFFTTTYMPIVVENDVASSAVDGRIDIVKIVNSGAGFNANVSNNFLNIVSVKGDGTGANIRVNAYSTGVNGGNIVGYTVISGGNNYTRATITLVDENKIVGTANANLIAVIGPPGGHGSNVASELGASTLMISVAIEGDENDQIPTQGGGGTQFRQIGLLKDPKVSGNTTALASVYRTTTKYSLVIPTGTFVHRESVFVGANLSSANLTALVDFYDSVNDTLYVNNIVNDGTVNVANSFSITGANSGASATVISSIDPGLKLYSGELLYIQNSSAINRDPDEHQQFKIVLKF